MRIGRLLLGAGIVATSLWIIVGEQISGVSSDAVVNARLSTVRAPMAGTLTMPMHPLGGKFAKGETIATLEAAHPDDRRLDDLEMEVALAEAELSYRDWISDVTAEASDRVLRDVEIVSNEDGVPMLDEALEEKAARDPEMARAKARLEAVRARLGREWYRVGQDAGTELKAPVEGLLWEVLAGEGEYVERGQDVAKFMMCGSALITLSVPDNVYARLSVGQSASFRLDGSSTVYEGTITRMAGAGAETIYRNLAVAPSLKHRERYDVAMIVPDLRADETLRCTVGQTGRVFFDSRPLDWLRTALR